VGGALQHRKDPIEALLKTKKKSIHPGSLGQLKPLEEALLKYIF
jgi:hypothetical protein